MATAMRMQRRSCTRYGLHRTCKRLLRRRRAGRVSARAGRCAWQRSLSCRGLQGRALEMCEPR